ncbi:hypothetical protein BH11CYA1_BH11CYA1_50350 [soil metagenome]
MYPSETSYPGTNAAPVQLTRLKKRLVNLQSLLSGLDKQIGTSNPDASALVSRARANSVTASNLSAAADVVINQSALEAMRCESIKLEVTVISFEDVAALSPLKALAGPIPEATSDTSEPLIDFSAKPGCTTCAAPDPSKWFEQLQAGTPQEPAAASCEAPRVVVELPIDLNSKVTRVDELIRLSEFAIAHAEGQLRQARMALCHSDGGSCSI